MITNTLEQKLKDGRVVLGISNSYPSPGIIEAISPGYDFVWIDGQHGQHDLRSALTAIQTSVGCGVDTLLRVPTHDHGLLGAWADLTPSAVMVPMVNTVEQARAIVEALHFAPLGSRSYGGRRLVDKCGRDGYRLYKLLVIIQIETEEAVSNAEAMAKLDGIDGLFFGPDDMKVQLGLPINASMVETPPLRQAMERTAAAIHKSGKFGGIVAGDRKAVELVQGAGYRMIVVGGDVLFMRNAAQAKLAEVKGAAPVVATTSTAY